LAISIGWIVESDATRFLRRSRFGERHRKLGTPFAIRVAKTMSISERNPLHSSLCAGFRALKANNKSALSGMLFSGNRLTLLSGNPEGGPNPGRRLGTIARSVYS